MNNFFERENYHQSDIEELFENEVEESLNLEFKRAGSLSKKNSSKKEIGKDISAFANSDGGIIIYGIAEENHIAKRPSFIDGNEFTKEWLEQIINTNIQRRITDLRIFPIRFGEEIKQTIYVVKIPSSKHAPHMCSRDNRFYRRYEFESIPMYEYEVRNLYNRKDKTDLEIKDPQFSKGTLNKKRDGGISNQEIILKLGIENISNSIEKEYKLEMEVPSQFRSGYESKLNFHHRRNGTDGNYYYTFYKADPLFQGETTSFGVAKLILTPQNIDLIKDKYLILKLYYSNGVKEQRYVINDIVDLIDLDISVFK